MRSRIVTQQQLSKISCILLLVRGRLSFDEHRVRTVLDDRIRARSPSLLKCSGLSSYTLLPFDPGSDREGDSALTVISTAFMQTLAKVCEENPKN